MHASLLLFYFLHIGRELFWFNLAYYRSDLQAGSHHVNFCRQMAAAGFSSGLIYHLINIFTENIRTASYGIIAVLLMMKLLLESKGTAMTGSIQPSSVISAPAR
jgi:hypothetical protein